MKILLLLLAHTTLVYCGKAKKQIHDQPIDNYKLEYKGSPALGLIESDSHLLEAAPVVTIAASDHHSKRLIRPGYSVGGPLASIAKGSIFISV